MFKNLSLLLAAAVLSGCAGMSRLSNDVSSYGSWPADRKAAAFVFERLPSQQQQPEQQQILEDAARPALEAAGFKQVGEASSASYTVQLGARITGDDRWPGFYDGFGGLGWRGFGRYPRFGFGYGYGYDRFGFSPYATPQYDREVMLLIRDRLSGQTIYETRASNTGYVSAINALLPAMFEAAMKDFPTGGINPRRVVTQVGR